MGGNQAPKAGRHLPRSRRYDPAAVRTSQHRHPRIALFATFVGVMALLIAPGFASAVTFVPKSGGSPNANAIADLFKCFEAIGDKRGASHGERRDSLLRQIFYDDIGERLNPRSATET